MPELFLFFGLTYIVTWGLWLAASYTAASLPHALLFYLGVFAPGLVALFLTWRSGQALGVETLVRRLVDWDVGARWYVFAVGYMATIKLAAALLHRAAIGTWPRFGDVPWYLMLAATAGSTLVGGQAGEELGWRGFALPRLATRLGLGGASVLLGVLWAAWHLPLFYTQGSDILGQSFPLYALQVTALSVALGWLYGRTRGSLVPIMLLHAAVNNTKDIVPSAEPHATDPWALSHSLVGWLTVALLWLCAIGFLFDMRRPQRGSNTRAPSVAT